MVRNLGEIARACSPPATVTIRGPHSGPWGRKTGLSIASPGAPNPVACTHFMVPGSRLGSSSGPVSISPVSTINSYRPPIHRHFSKHPIFRKARRHRARLQRL